VRVAPVLIYLLLSAFVHVLATRLVLRSFPSLARRRRLVIRIAIALTLLPMATRTLQWFWRSTIASSLFALSLIELISVALAALLATLAGFLTENALSALSHLRKPSTEVEPAPRDAAGVIGRRVAVERIVGGTALGAAGVALGWGAVRGRHAFEIQEIVVRVPGWPRVLDGYTIAQVSDVHVGAFVGERELDEGFELVKRIRPDLVVATGDLVDYDAYAIDPLAARLARVGARDGAFAIAGNHDHYAGVAIVAERLTRAGVRVFYNEGVHMRPRDGGGFALLGVDDLQGRNAPADGWLGPDLGAAIQTVPRELPRILLAHQPMFLYESQGRVALQLSGHTHGGQINPGFSPARLLTRWVAGRYEEGGTTLWVNRGFGTAGPPSRINAPPEVTKIVIVS
jgi:predicted MPP superfamily phosphohydrolase